MSIIVALNKLSSMAKFSRRGTSSFRQSDYGQQTFFSRSVLRLLLCVGLLTATTALQAANWYVSSTVASSGNGQSWATAWKNSSNIQWGSIAAGDTIYFDGGPAGLSYGAFSTITASGTAANYITIARSTEPGRDGIVTFATAFTISGSYIKFDGGGYKQVSGNTYRCGIVFTCSGNTFAGSIPSGAAVAATGQRPWFRYCYFNGTYGAGTGHSFGANNSTGFVLERCWFYQSNYEDQWVYAATTGGGSVSITNTVFQDNNKPNRTDTSHRDVANPWTGSGGWNLYIVGCILFNTPGHASDQPQGDEFLLQVGYGGGTTPLNEVIAINNVCYNTARFIAFGSSNSGVNRFVVYNNTIRNVVNGSGLGITTTSPAPAPTQANNIQTTTSNPGFVDGTNPLGADGIPFTADDGFNITSTSAAINAGTSVGVTADIRGNARVGNPDLGAYEYGSGGQAEMSVNAGADKSITLPSNSTTLGGSVLNPLSGTLNLSWSRVSGPGTVTFGSPASATTTATFSIAGTYTLRLTATVLLVSVSDDVVVTVNPAPQVFGLNFEAEAGVITAPFVISGGVISQASETSLSAGGRATYSFLVPTAGNYLVEMRLNAPSEAGNSVFVNIDAEPQDPTAVWHIPVTVGTEARIVSWQGGGTYDAPEFVPKTFTLTAGTHQLIIRGRESGVEINSISIVKPIELPDPPTNLRVTTTN